RRAPCPILLLYTTLFRSGQGTTMGPRMWRELRTGHAVTGDEQSGDDCARDAEAAEREHRRVVAMRQSVRQTAPAGRSNQHGDDRSEEHTSELHHRTISYA